MRAVICSRLDGPEALTVGEYPDPKAQQGQVVVEVRAASLNFPDALMVRGLYQVKPALPFVPGAELAGIVREVEKGVERPRLGDRSAGLRGTVRQLCAVDGRAHALRGVTSRRRGLRAHVRNGVALRDASRSEETLSCSARACEPASRRSGGKAMGARDRVRVERGEAGCAASTGRRMINYATEDLRAAR
jgi:NADPH2:quinone reductase